MSVFFDDVFILLYKKRYVYSYVSFFENSSYLKAVVLIMIGNIQKLYFFIYEQQKLLFFLLLNEECGLGMMNHCFTKQKYLS